MRTLLWLYADLVVHKGNPHSPEVFNRACTAYNLLKGVPPLSMFAVTEDHFITGPGKGLAGLDSGMAAPMGISSRVPAETRVRLRHINAVQKASGQVLEKPAQALDGYDDGLGSGGEYEDGAGDDDGGGGGGGGAMGSFTMFPPGMGAWPMPPPGFPGAFPMIHGMPGFPHMMQRPGMPFMPQHFMSGVPGFMAGPHHLPPQNGGARRWPNAPRQQQRLRTEEGSEDQDWEPASGGDGQRGEGHARGHGDQSSGDNAADMLLALADAANLAADEDCGGGSSRKRAGPPHGDQAAEPQQRRQRTSGGGSGYPSSAPAPSQRPYLGTREYIPPQPDDMEKQALARLAREAAASLNQSRQNQSQQDSLWQQLELKLSGAATAATAADVVKHEMLPEATAPRGAEEEALHRRATNSSLGTEEPLALPPRSTDGLLQPFQHRRSSTGGLGGEEGGATNAADAAAETGVVASPTSCTRDKELPNPAAVGAAGRLSTPPSSAVGGGSQAPAVASSAMEDSVVETLGKLATDPSLSAQERVQLISSYMKAVQNFVKVTVD